MWLLSRMSGTITNRGMHTAAYNASKSAVLQLARSLAVEFGPNKIRVNSLSPGYILTQMTADLLETDPALAKQWTNDNPLSRLSKPWEFKGPAVFLASDASSFMTGSDLLVDGGHTRVLIRPIFSPCASSLTPDPSLSTAPGDSPPLATHPSPWPLLLVPFCCAASHAHPCNLCREREPENRPTLRSQVKWLEECW